MYVNKAIQT